MSAMTPVMPIWYGAELEAASDGEHPRLHNGMGLEDSRDGTAQQRERYEAA